MANRRLVKAPVIAILILARQPAAVAADTLTLDQAVAIALGQNRNLQSSALEIQKAEDKLKATATRRLPSFNVDALSGVRPSALTPAAAAAAFAPAFAAAAMSAFAFGSVLKPIASDSASAVAMGATRNTKGTVTWSQRSFHLPGSASSPSPAASWCA